MLRIFRMLQNSFEIQTRSSHKKAVSLLSDTVQKLQNSPNALLVAIYTAFSPFFNAYIALNDAVGMLEGTYKSKTNTFEHLMDDIGTKLRYWEGQVRAIFPEDSDEEIDIFPHKRNPFYDGTYEQRLGALRVLRDKLLEYTGAHASLVPVQADVAAFYTLCNTARGLQQGKEGDLGEVRTEREAQRVVTMNAYLGIVYGGLLQLFYTNLQIIGDYIDFSLLYDTGGNEPLIINGDINSGQVINVNALVPDLDAGAETVIKLKNTSPNPLSFTFYSANGPADLPGPGPQFTVASGATMDVTAGDFQFGTYPNFNIHNPSGMGGSWEIEFDV